jgi:MinD-like ATPase involved in chromosome partitioning or flagellar assembly
MTPSIVQKSASGETASAEFQLLRAFVERAIPGRAVILVTSAKNGDGKSLTAYSLADCLARAGRRTVLVDATTETSRDIALPNPDRSRVICDLAVYVAMPKPQVPLSREAAAQFVENMRASHEFTIIDSAALLTSEMAMAFAEAVDGVLLSVRLGRAASGDDELTVQLLDRCGGRVLGVVAASPQAIGQFERRRAAKPAAELAATKKRISWARQIRRVVAGLAAAIVLTLGAGAASSSALSPAAGPAAAPVTAPAGGAPALRHIGPALD